MEAISEFLLLDGGNAVRRQLTSLIRLCTSFFNHPTQGSTFGYVWPDGRPAEVEENRLCMYGHDLELVWLLLEALRRLGRPVEDVSDWAGAVGRNALRCGYDRVYGGVYFSGPFGLPASRLHKAWWSQAEAMVAFLELYRLTGDAQYIHAFVGTLDFFDRHCFAADGGTRGYIGRRGEGDTRVRASLWQGPYHSGRSMAVCADLLDSLAGRS